MTREQQKRLNLDDAMIAHNEFRTNEVSGVEFGEIETCMIAHHYGLSTWPSWCERLIKYEEFDVEWEGYRRTKVTPRLLVYGW